MCRCPSPLSPGDNHIVVMIGDKDCDFYDNNDDNDEWNDDNVHLDDFCPRPRTRPNRRKSVFYFQLNLVRCVQLLIVMNGEDNDKLVNELNLNYLMLSQI